MNRRIGIIYSILLLVLCGCRKELDELPGRNAREEMPVRFTAERPQGDVLTRAIVDKEEFSAGDVIHVSAKFTLDDGNIVIKYATLTLDEHGEWNNETIFDMGWPWNATGAEFTAYYLENWNGPITTPGRPVEPVVLDRFEFQGQSMNPDPLKAEAKVEGYGQAVHLRFEHLCTRLTVEDVGDEEEYWLRFRYSPGVENPRFVKNACQLTLNDDKTLQFDFVTEQSGKVSSQVFVKGDGKRAVTFHLAPGDYSRFSLTRRNNYAYITISNVDALRELEANKAYSISLANLQGNITPDDDAWIDEPDLPEVPQYDDFDINAFLRAIRDCKKDYICKLKDGDSVVVLKKDDWRNEMLLMQDVDFEGADFTAVDLPNMVTFDGGGHSILNVAYPMFNTLYGTVTQLNIYANRKKIEVWENNTEWGMLARISDKGTISNIRLEGMSVEFTIPNVLTTQGKTYNIGALVGWVKSGSLSEITLAGDVSVIVDSEYTGDYIVFAGGVVGQCSGSMEHIDNLGSHSTIHVTNKCRGYSSRYTGGLAGAFNEAIMDHCNVNTIVDAGESSGTWNYAGGIAGAVRTTSGGSGSAAIVDVTVTGSVKGGNIVPGGESTSESGTTTTHSSTGGIVGHVQNASVTGGIVLSKVSVGKQEGLNEYSHYTVGGVIGSMTNAANIRKNEGCIFFNANDYILTGYTSGTFCGGGGSTTELQAEGNTAVGMGKFVGSDR